MRRLPAIAGPILSLAFLGASGGCAGSPSSAPRSSTVTSPEPHTMKIRFTISGKAATATLIDSPTARDFIALLPLALKMEDYASTEKVSYLPKKLTTQGAPAGIDPDVGDITYYAPWGNLAIFYRDFGYSTGLIKLGRFDHGIEAFDVRGSFDVTIEAVSK